MEHLIFAHARVGNLEEIRKYLQDDISLLHSTMNEVLLSPKTLLHVAIENGHLPLTEMLLRDFQAKLDKQCLYLAVYDRRDLYGYSIIKHFTKKLRFEMVRLLLGHDPDLLYCDAPDRHNTALICAVQQNHIRTAKLLLEQGRANPNEVDSQNRSALYAIFEEEEPREVEDALRLTKMLVKYGANLNIPQPSLVLHLAIIVRGYEQLVFYMIKKGADVYLRETDGGKNAIDVAIATRVDNLNLPVEIEQAWLNRDNDGYEKGDDDDDDDDNEIDEYENIACRDDVDHNVGSELGALDESQIENLLQNLPNTVKNMYNFVDVNIKRMKYSAKLRLYHLIMSGGEGGSMDDDHYEDYDDYHDYDGCDDYDVNLGKWRHQGYPEDDEEEDEDEEEAQRAIEARLTWLEKTEKMKQQSSS